MSVAAQFPAFLQIRDLTKRFTGTLALDGVDFDVRRGEVHALLGENGAGKSTLIKVLAGVHAPDSGVIRLDGHIVHPMSQTLPIAFIHQDLGLVESMTVAENVALFCGYARRLGLISWKQVRRSAERALAATGSGIDPDTEVQSLSAAEKSLVAIGRALTKNADLLILDEPTAALPEADVAHLLAALRQLRKADMGILYVTHRIDEVFRIADRVTVLRDGRKVATTAVEDVTPASLVSMIVGRSISDVYVKPPPRSKTPVLQVSSLATEAAGPVSFSVARGEILGLVGLRGAGHHEIGRAIFGAVKQTGGEVLLDGDVVRVRAPEEAMRRGIGFLSSKRAEESLAAKLLVRENLFMNPVATGKKITSIMSRRAELRAARAALDRFNVRPADPERAVATLSGGNQQKVVLARWLEAGVRLLILEEPTIGVDVGAKVDIYAVLQEALDRGTAALLISSDVEEVAGIAHRALVFSRGKVVAELARDDLTIPRLVEAASGGGAQEIRSN